MCNSHSHCTWSGGARLRSVDCWTGQRSGCCREWVVVVGGAGGRVCWSKHEIGALAPAPAAPATIGCVCCICSLDGSCDLKFVCCDVMFIWVGKAQGLRGWHRAPVRRSLLMWGWYCWAGCGGAGGRRVGWLNTAGVLQQPQMPASLRCCTHCATAPISAWLTKPSACKQ